MRGAALRRVASADRLAAAPAAMAPTPPPTRQRQGLGLSFRGYHLGLRVPSEMWGATALALRLAQPPSGFGGALPHLHRSASVLAQVRMVGAAACKRWGPWCSHRQRPLWSQTLVPLRWLGRA